MHSVQDPGELVLPELELLSEGGAVLYKALLLQRREGAYGLNWQAFRTTEAEGQDVSGDGTIIIGEHTFYVIVRPENGLPVERKSILEALKDMARLRIGDRTQEAKGLRIASEVPIGDKAYRVGLVFAPLEATSTDGVSEGIGL